MEELIKEWVLPLATLGGILVAIVLFITKKDSSQDIDINVMNTNVKNLTCSFDDFKKYVTDELGEIKNNHLMHLSKDIKDLDKKVTEVDKKVYAHLQNHKKARRDK